MYLEEQHMSMNHMARPYGMIPWLCIPEFVSALSTLTSMSCWRIFSILSPLIHQPSGKSIQSLLLLCLALIRIEELVAFA
jgi:hypothetical protein